MPPGATQCIGVLTGGGGCPELNTVIHLVVKTAILVYRWEMIGIEDGCIRVSQLGKIQTLNLQDVRGILPRRGNILGATYRANPFRNEVE